MRTNFQKGQATMKALMTPSIANDFMVDSSVSKRKSCVDPTDLVRVNGTGRADLDNINPAGDLLAGAAIFTNDPHRLVGAFVLTHQLQLELVDHLLAQFKGEVLFLCVERLQRARHIHDG